jgi:hypothetical protein
MSGGERLLCALRSDPIAPSTSERLDFKRPVPVQFLTERQFEEGGRERPGRAESPGQGWPRAVGRAVATTLEVARQV